MSRMISMKQRSSTSHMFRAYELCSLRFGSLLKLSSRFPSNKRYDGSSSGGPGGFSVCRSAVDTGRCWCLPADLCYAVHAVLACAALLECAALHPGVG
jgi:hypothetical protein